MITKTRWGSYEIIKELPGYKVKILTVNPGCGISYQRHFKRAEQWWIVEGILSVARKTEDGQLTFYEMSPNGLMKELYFCKKDWHQFWNFTDKPAKILEIQIGKCEEKDIERTQYEWIGED